MPTKKNPPIIKIAGLFICLFAFAIGFWHTHLGLKEFKILSSEWGSLVFSGLILLVLLVSYFAAVNGKTVGLFFYMICAIFFFTFNMNSFYPTYLGRKLLKEEAIVINDSMQNFASRINREFGKEEITKKTNSLSDLNMLLKQEISKQSGFGERAKDYLRQINEIIGEPYIKPNIKIGSSMAEWDTIASDYYDLVNKRIQSFIIQNVGGDNASIITRINEIKSMYSPELEKIITDNAKIDIETIRSNSQIKKLQDLVTKMDNVCTDANKISSKLDKEKQTYICTNYGEVKSQNLGTFAHTIKSVFDRMGNIDTWGIIILCLFIDLIVPLAVYFLIRNKEDDYEDNSFFNILFRKNKNFHKSI